MRGTIREITKTKQVEYTEVANQEEIYFINENKYSQMIEVRIAFKNDKGEIIAEEIYNFTGDKYDLLMSQSPSFAPNKLQNEYREVDIWYVVDLIRGEQQPS